MDFAGGTVVHLNAGVAALVARRVRRPAFPRPRAPHNMTMAVTGAAMLWVGWFGFNAGSALAADGAAGMAMLVTHVGAATGRSPGCFANGCATASLPRSASSPAWWPAWHHHARLGLRLADRRAHHRRACRSRRFFATNFMKRALNIDDSLDVFPVHGVGGLLGTLLTGIWSRAPSAASATRTRSRWAISS